MQEYKQSPELLEALDLPDLTNLNWSDTTAWRFVEAIGERTLSETAKYIKRCPVVAFSFDESEGETSMTMYTVSDAFDRFDHYLALISIPGRADAAALVALLMNALQSKAGMSKEEIMCKLVCIAGDGAAVIQGAQGGVIARFQRDHAPFTLPSRCSAHSLQLASQDSSDHPMIQSVFSMVSASFSFFHCSILKKNKLRKKQLALGLPTNTILRDVQTRWLSHTAPMNRVHEQYAALLMVAEEVNKEPGSSDAAFCLMNRLC